ncbi:phage protein NinX family protein [Pseudomonas aeruginosa]
MSETVEVKIWDLEGAALDWAVAMAEGEEVIVHGIGQYRYDVRGGIHCCKYGCTFGPRSITEEVERYEPSDSWAQGGPLIEKHMIRTHYAADTEKRADAGCIAQTWRPYAEAYGRTLLIAACRAIVTASLGETVSVPAELIK